MQEPNADLSALAARYCSSGDTAGKWDEKVAFVRSRGSYLYDRDENRFLDMQMFNSAANFGYAQGELTAALQNALDTLPGCGGEFITESRVALAREITEAIERRFGVLGRVHFSVSGAQTVDDVLKLIASRKGRRTVFAFEGGYHGRTIAASNISASFRYRNPFAQTADARFVPFPNCTRCPYGKELATCRYYCADQFTRLFDSELSGVVDSRNGDCETSAFVVEPVLGRGGYLAPPPDYFRKIENTLRAHDVLLVADEIQMGFFRTGRLWSVEHFGVRPDIILFGKAITNGMFPVSGFWARADLLDAAHWPPSSTHTTFGGHPLGMAAALGVFDLLRRHDFTALAESAGAKLECVLREIAARDPSIRNIRRLGLAISVELCRPNSDKPYPELASLVKRLGVLAPIRNRKGQTAEGLILTTGGYNDNIFMLSPSLFISDLEIEQFGELFWAFMSRAQRQLVAA
ncbi:diaminobutyrate--2-oxoglutarate aminotransferase [mine drainage metagenome]|uniref:Diaminobutyrate--2-oxoglutarate aminotransferase n=1 Tax=mine drainage metagenome TaxID=410659 RepID=A0A1J5QTL3_9ZZZZ